VHEFCQFALINIIGVEAGNFWWCKGYFAQIQNLYATNILQIFCSCWYILFSLLCCHWFENRKFVLEIVLLKTQLNKYAKLCKNTVSSWLGTLEHLCFTVLTFGVPFTFHSGSC